MGLPTSHGGLLYARALLLNDRSITNVAGAKESSRVTKCHITPGEAWIGGGIDARSVLRSHKPAGATEYPPKRGEACKTLCELFVTVAKS